MMNVPVVASRYRGKD